MNKVLKVLGLIIIDVKQIKEIFKAANSIFDIFKVKYLILFTFKLISNVAQTT